jgi:uncharacterized protein YoxC
LQINEGWSIFKELSQMPFTVVFSLVCLGIFVYFLFKIAPLLIQQNKLIDNNSRAVEGNTKAVEGLVAVVNSFQALSSDMKVHTNKVESNINAIHGEICDVKQSVNALNGRIDTALFLQRSGSDA